MKKVKRRTKISISSVFKLEHETEEEVFSCPEDSSQKPSQFKLLATVLQVLSFLIELARLFGG